MKKYNKYYKLVTHYLPGGKVKQEIEYTGKHYICRFNKTEFRKRRVYFLTLTLCSTIIMMCAGLLDTSSSRVFYVAIPYVCLFLPIIFGLIGAINLITLDNKLEYAAYDKSIKRIHRASAGQLALSSITIIGDICYLFFAVNMDKLGKELIFLGGMIIVLVFGILLLRIRKMIIYEVEEN